MNIKGFKVNFLGDSITEGVGVVDRANCRYDKRLEKMCELSKVNNYGIGGTRLAHQQHASEKPRHDLCFCGRVYNMDKTADMVVVYGGVNDYIHGDAPFGEIGDKTPATFCGGVYFLMNFLRENYAGKPVVFMTPARCFLRKEVDDRIVSTHAKKLPGGKPLIDYADEYGREHSDIDYFIFGHMHRMADVSSPRRLLFMGDWQSRPNYVALDDKGTITLKTI